MKQLPISGLVNTAFTDETVVPGSIPTRVKPNTKLGIGSFFPDGQF